MRVANLPYVPLGALRFLLAALVLTGHGLATMLPGILGLGLETSGVAVFFVVSGYVIVSAHDTFYRGAVGRFLVNRFLRIFPPFWVLYLLALAAFAVVDGTRFHQIMSIREFAGTFSLIGGLFAVSDLRYVSHVWSVAVEIQFYLAAATLFWAVDRGQAERFLVPVLLVAALAGYALVVATDGYHRFYGGLQYAPFFALGAAVYATRQRLMPRALGWAVIALCFALSLSIYDHYIGEVWVTNPYRPAALTLFAALSALFGWLAFRRCEGRVAIMDKKLGDLTYPLYLCHYPVLGVLSLSGLMGGLESMPLFVAVSLGMSWLLLLLSDRPIHFLRDRVRGRPLGA